MAVPAWRDALQWGRRSMAAETREQRRDYREWAARLQWGRRSMAAETRSVRSRSRPSRRGPCFNGAAARWRRRRRPRDCPKRGRGALQWGRRSMAAETDARRAVERRAGRLASMGPPLDGGGDARRQRRGRGTRNTSMGPPLDGGGDGNAATNEVLPRFASMGPPLDGGGDNQSASVLVDVHDQFGHASMGPPLDGGGDGEATRRSRAGVMYELQWGRRSMAAETATGPRNCSGVDPQSFNGAAARWRRRHRGGTEAATPARPASMGPPLDGGGDGVAERRRCWSNLATTLQWGRRSMAAETLKPSPDASQAASLQWGRRSMAAETAITSTGAASCASMGPPLDGGGDVRYARSGLRSPWCASMGPPLDGGGDRRGSTRSHRRPASMGPPLDGGGDRAAFAQPLTAWRGFNGAAARWRRRRDARWALFLHWTQAASMGPPLDGGGDRGGGRRRAGWRLVASMGPPLDGGGDIPRSSARRPGWPGFNGAAARWRRTWGRPLDGGGDFNGAAARSRRRDLGVMARRRSLQWGRRSMAAETDAAGPRTLDATRPARGMRFNGAAARWRRRRTRFPPHPSLQWGRRSMAAETGW